MTSGPDDPEEGPVGGSADDPMAGPAAGLAGRHDPRRRPDDPRRRPDPDPDPDSDPDSDPVAAPDPEPEPVAASDPVPDPVAAPVPNPSDGDPAEPPPSLLRRARARLRSAGQWLRAHARHALVVGIVTAVAGALATVGAHQLPKLFDEPPPGCPGAGCDGRNPKDTGCAYDALTWEPTVGNPVRIQLRYSKDCGDVWGRIVNGEPGDMVTLRVAGGSARSASIDYNHDKYTAMATVGATFRVRLCAVPSTSPRRIGKWIKYCFEATEHAAWD